ncbi:OLC1v1017718C2 [Oldenlandia corymbosa var. corymbosa]|nr:OLC1v1017718C2 [Oldenlandia corymbosa var. corymbosa]
MKHIAEAYIGSTVTDAVITVPAHFNLSQRQATIDAGEIAGINVLNIITEPAAAAIAYGLDLHSAGSDEKNILVFDLGGGTFDVAVLTIDKGNIQVRATCGDSHLGGKDFDDRMVNHFMEEFKKKHKKDMSGSPKAIRRLRTVCEKAKRVLSSNRETTIEVDSLFEDIDYSTTITRSEFEELNSDLFAKCMKTVEKCLRDAKMKKNTLDDVVLVGGSSRIPKVQQMLSNFLNGKELCKKINPDEAVACGAAVQAAILSGRGDDKVRDLMLTEITPLSLGLGSMGDKMWVVIPRNTPIPTKVSIRCYTAHDNQTYASFKVYEGESSIASKNHLLAEYVVDGIQKALKGVPIELCFNLRANGILEVSEPDTRTGAEKSITIVNSGRLSRDEVEKMMKEANEFAAEDEKHMEKQKARNDFEKYFCDMRNFIGKTNLSSVDRRRVEYEINKAFQWLDGQTEVAEVREYEKKKMELTALIQNQSG